MSWKKKIFNLLEKQGDSLIVVSFYPPQVEEFLSFLTRKYDLLFPKRGPLESEFRRKFPPKGQKEIEVEIELLPQSLVPSKGIKLALTHPSIPICRVNSETIQKLLILYPERFTFSCASFFGIPCPDWRKALTTLWEGGKCRKECSGLWELFFGKCWFYYHQQERKVVFDNFSVNEREAKRAKVLHGLIKEARRMKKALKVVSLEEVLLLPLGRESVLKMHEQDDCPVVVHSVQAALEVEATFLGKNFSYKFVSSKEIQRWKEEKNVSIPDYAAPLIRFRSLL